MTPKHRACSHVIQYPVFCPNNIYGRCHTQIYDIYGIKNIFFLLFYVFILTSFLLIPVCRGNGIVHRAYGFLHLVAACTPL